MNYNICIYYIVPTYTMCHWRNGPGSTVVNGQLLLCSNATFLRKKKNNNNNKNDTTINYTTR